LGNLGRILPKGDRATKKSDLMRLVMLDSGNPQKSPSLMGKNYVLLLEYLFIIMID